MSLERYQEEFHVRKQVLNTVIGIFQKEERKSLVNKTLKELQLYLKQQLDQYQEIQVAFVYETPSLEVKPFKPLKREDPIYYKEPGEKSSNYDLAYIWLMGMALFEQKQKEEKVPSSEEENQFYLIMDEPLRYEELERIVVKKKSGKFSLHPRFKQVKFFPILLKTRDINGDILEKYAREYGKVCLVNSDRRGEAGKINE